jgi:hypothetical protein
MPESGITKHNYFLCQFINPVHGHKGERCNCYDTPSQKRTTLAKQRLERLHANRNINRGSTSGNTESAVASDPAVTSHLPPQIFSEFSYFISQDTKNTGSSCSNTTWPSRNLRPLVTALHHLVWGLVSCLDGSNRSCIHHFGKIQIHCV